MVFLSETDGNMLLLKKMSMYIYTKVNVFSFHSIYILCNDM